MSQWLNTEQPIDQSTLEGRVVVAAGFQMLCPGCVDQTIPQLKRVHAMFPADEVAVIGLHTVFEHHEAMGPPALAAFLHEYKVAFPVAVDAPSPDGGPIPSTMRRYAMQGTPTLLLIDRSWHLRRQSFGHIADLQLGAEIMALVCEEPRINEGIAGESGSSSSTLDCDEHGCRVR
ncbi:hypothetical protein ACTMSW_26130 [Micromonospora sp. BQ11]|uniref:hypothetical protein n=1 Tax=Micromonospora sp. BQ11 TaxID=3452212 RepID=UPI003F8C1FF2